MLILKYMFYVKKSLDEDNKKKPVKIRVVVRKPQPKLDPTR